MDIDKQVEYWHNNKTDQTLKEFLGLSDEEYEAWLKGGNDVIERDRRHTMSREAELIQKIDEHIKKAGGLYGLELPNSDLQVIRAALCKTVEAEPVDREYGGFGDKVSCCQTCGKPVINYWTTGAKPDYCQFCGQRLRGSKGGEPSIEK